MFKSRYDPESETPDLTGKVALVTGGNAGTGFETVKHLAKYGAKVYMVARSPERAKEAIEKINALGLKGTVEFLHMDLSSLKNVKQAADEFVTKEEKLDILVNNAGMLATSERILTPEGLVTQLATNHFGHFLLTETLLPLLKNAAGKEGSDVRIVVVASSAYDYAPTLGKVTSLKDLDVSQGSGTANGMKRYGTSKMCNVWFTRELQSRLAKDYPSILVASVDPGAVASPGARAGIDTLPWPLPGLVWPILKMTFNSPEQGAQAANFASTSTRMREFPIETYKGQQITSPNKLAPLKANTEAANDDLAKQLWVLSEKVVPAILSKGSVSMEWEA